MSAIAIDQYQLASTFLSVGKFSNSLRDATIDEARVAKTGEKFAVIENAQRMASGFRVTCEGIVGNILKGIDPSSAFKIMSRYEGHLIDSAIQVLATEKVKDFAAKAFAGDDGVTPEQKANILRNHGFQRLADLAVNPA